MSNKVTIKTLQSMKIKGEKISALTAYDFLFGEYLDEVGIDVLLVGDSVGMVFSGYETTLPVTLDDIVYHSCAVRRSVKNALLVADMPFLSYQISDEDAMRSAGRLMKEAQVEAVKMEGGAVIAPLVRKMVQAGIPVMGHLGMVPQSVHQLGGYKVQGKGQEDAEKLIADAQALEQAGVFAIVLEKIPATLAEKVTKAVNIPTIGIGAGNKTDGQILVTYDLLGMFDKFQPKFVRRYAELAAEIKQSVKEYIRDTKSGSFPNDEESY